jgi:hypothetical protein
MLSPQIPTPYQGVGYYPGQMYQYGVGYPAPQAQIYYDNDAYMSDFSYQEDTSQYDRPKAFFQARK